MLQLCRLWQHEHGIHLDAVLRCDDFGLFSNLGLLDKATRRFAKRDPEELEFAEYFRVAEPRKHNPLVETMLKASPGSLVAVRCPVIWCEGNHEEFYSLREQAGSAPLSALDAFDVLHWLRPGNRARLDIIEGPATSQGFQRAVRLRDERALHDSWWPAGAGCLTMPNDPAAVERGFDDPAIGGLPIAALGGSPEPADVTEEDYGITDVLGWVGHRNCERLVGALFEVLITHSASSATVPFGSNRITRLVNVSRPACHFYGHHSRRIEPVVVRETQSSWLKYVNFGRHEKGMAPYGKSSLVAWECSLGRALTTTGSRWSSRAGFVP